MNIVKDGKICVSGDCVGFTTSSKELADWANRNHVQKIPSTNPRTAFMSIEDAEYFGNPVRVVMRIGEDGLQSFSLRRIDWLNKGNKISDYDKHALFAEFLALRSIVQRAVGREPDNVLQREVIWDEETYEVTVSYEPTAFEIGIFFAPKR